MMLDWLRRIIARLFGKGGERRNDMSEIRERCAPEQDRTIDPPITLYAKATRSNGGVEWALGTENPPSGKCELDFPKDAPGRQIVIHLVATQGLNIDFDTKDPVWVGETGCPPPKNGKSDQLQFVGCDARKLTLYDPNSRECTLYYQMNFTGAEPFDPEIRNGGTTVE